MEEKFEKVNDYTVQVQNTLGSNTVWAKILTRIFNFKSAQVTTLLDEWLTTPEGVALSNQMKIENFSDIQSYEEIKLMHEKLTEMGGAPPKLSGILPILDK